MAHHYEECGLRNVWLANGYQMHETPYGGGISIKDADGLHRLIGRNLATEKPSLTGDEFSFLRKELGLSQSRLAHWWGYDAQSVALWEKRGRVPRIANRFIRAIYLEKTAGNSSITEIIERLADADWQEESRLTFEETPAGWRLAA